MAVVAPGTRAVAQLHEQGWIEARGELLSAKEYPELFDAIGRTWTSDGVSEGRFAVPDVKDSGRIRAANPFGVMGPGDLVAGGRTAKPWLNPAPISYWIYAGRAPALR
jgi:microcystin-dependent protein